MGKRRIEVIDLTQPDETIDLTSVPDKPVGDPGHLRGGRGGSTEIEWISKLPKLEASQKKLVARALSVRENINVSELSKDAAWFEEAELVFKVAMAPRH